MKPVAIAALTLLGFAACARQATRSDAEKAFVTNAASVGMLEGQLAAGALNHAVSEDVRQLAYGMIDDHRRTYRGLEKAAEHASLELPDSMIQDDRDAYIRLTSLRGEEFDRAYLQATIEGQQQAIAAFRAEIARSRSDIAKWAEDTLPTLEKHLARARELSARASTVAEAGPER